MKGPSRSAAVPAVLLIPYVPFWFGLQVGEGVLGAIFVCSAGLAAPGAVGILLPGGRGAPFLFVRALAAVLVLNGASAILMKVLGVTVTASSFAVVLGVLTVAAGAVATFRAGDPPQPRRHLGRFAIAGAAFLLSFYAGTKVVPALEDQDSEVQGTAYGLVNALEPLCLTNRSTLYFFAHPLLLHALNASTLTLSGQLSTVRPPYDAALSELQSAAGPAGKRGLGAILAAVRGRIERPDRSLRWFRDVYQAFREDPALFGTRAPNFALAAAGALLLSCWIVELGASRLDAALATAAYLTLPEIFVRSGYGGYYALSAATFLSGASIAASLYGGARSGYLGGILAALSNQKALVLAASVGIYRSLRFLGDRTRSALAPAMPALLGVAAGMAAFWIYGLAIAPAEFIGDHVLDHGLRRFAGGEVLSRAGQEVYPSRTALWVEFGNHMGWVWIVLAAAALAHALRAAFQRAPEVSAEEPSHRASLGILSLWVLVGAVVFTATDWRQTKHLCLLVPALSVLIGALTNVSSRAARIAIRLGLVLALATNLVWIVRLAKDFDSLPVSPMW